MASIVKLPSGKFQAAVYVGRDENGKKIRKFITRDTEKACKAAAREYETDLYNNKVSDIPNMKFTAWCDKWLEVNRPNISPTTARSYKLYIDNDFKPFFKQKKLDSVTEIQVKEYVANELKKGLKPTTVNRKLVVLKRILKDALKGRSPASDVKVTAKYEFTPVLPTEEQFNDIREIFRRKGLEYEIIFLLAGWCGLRRGEIFALHTSDIDYNNMTLNVDKALALKEDGFEFEIKTPKTSNGIRTIAISDELISLLKQFTKNMGNKSQPLFSTNPDAFEKVWQRLKKSKAIPKGVRLHDLRHYQATVLFENGIPDQYAAERLGHDVVVLKRVYQHLGLEKKKQIDNHVRGLFGVKQE